jgi:hypothetical protein
LALTLVAFAIAVASVLDRFRGATGDYRLQLKWFVFAVALIAVVLLLGSIVEVTNGAPATAIGILYHLAFLALPLSIAVAVLRYHLYDIDLIINRTLIYGSLTAILTALYTAGVGLLNKIFIAVSGQKSDAAFVLGTFVVVVAFSPLRDWLQREVNRRAGHDSPTTLLDQFRTEIDSVVTVMDVDRVTQRLLDRATDAFGARGAAIYLDSTDASKPIYSRGRLDGEGLLEVGLSFRARYLGRLVLGSRRGDLSYTANDRAALQRLADSAAEAIALADHLGFRPSPNRSRT